MASRNILHCVNMDNGLSGGFNVKGHEDPLTVVTQLLAIHMRDDKFVLKKYATPGSNDDYDQILRNNIDLYEHIADIFENFKRYSNRTLVIDAPYCNATIIYYNGKRHIRQYIQNAAGIFRPESIQNRYNYIGVGSYNFNLEEIAKLN